MEVLSQAFDDDENKTTSIAFQSPTALSASSAFSRGLKRLDREWMSRRAGPASSERGERAQVLVAAGAKC